MTPLCSALVRRRFHAQAIDLFLVEDLEEVRKDE
jgi:hypothetical protein